MRTKYVCFGVFSRNVRVAEAVLSIALMLAGVSSSIAQDALPPEIFQLQFQHSNKCIDIPGYSTVNGRAVDQWDCVNQDNEMFYLNPVGAYFQIVNVYTHQCLNVKGKSVGNGSTVIQWPCTQDANSLWIPKQVDNEYSRYCAKHTRGKKCLTVRDGDLKNGGQLVISGRSAYSYQLIRTQSP